MKQGQLSHIVNRAAPPPWGEVSKIPWHDEEFSKRMLREHLRQDHDAASRRTKVIEQQIEWIQDVALGREGARVLDLGCGPGLYTTRLAERGHRCTGIDFSPASIAYSVAAAEAKHLADECEYILSDIRTAEYGSGFDLAMLIFGELNAFPPAEAGAILRRMNGAIKPSGRILLEVHTWDYVETLGSRAPSWFSAEQSVFCDAPHICLHEHWWHADTATTTERYFVIDGSDDVTTFVSTSQAYSDSGYAELLRTAGLKEVTREPTTEGVFFVLAEPLASGDPTSTKEPT